MAGNDKDETPEIEETTSTAEVDETADESSEITAEASEAEAATEEVAEAATEEVAEAATEEVAEAATEEVAEAATEEVAEAAIATPSSSAGSVDQGEAALASVQMLMLDEEHEVDLDAVELPPELAEPSFATVRKNTISWVILAVMLGTLVGGGLYINAQEALRVQVELLFTEGLVQHKRAHIIALRERYAKEDTYATNRYGEFSMVYSPGDAVVEVVQIKYVEKIGDFIKRYVNGVGDTRKKLGERELTSFKEKSSALGTNQKVEDFQIKNLPISSRTNPNDDLPENQGRDRACTDQIDDYCTFIYRVRISKEKYRPREFVIYNEYSLDAPDIGASETAQQLLFKNTGPSIFEVAWPGADLQPTPELFQEHYVRLWTGRIKCKLDAPEYAAFSLEGVPEKAKKEKFYAALRALPEDDMYRKISEAGHLQYGGIDAKSWTRMEWKSSLAELKQYPELWANAQKAVDECNCDAEGNPKACWTSLTPTEAPSAPK